MKKKTIKYLIWIILIAAILIFVPTTHKIAKEAEDKIVLMTFNEYNKRNDLFCIDKGHSLFGLRKYKVTDAPKEGISIYVGATSAVVTEVIRPESLEYILSESEKTTRYSAETHIPQIAIWKDFRGNLNSIDIDLRKKGNQLSADSSAYRDYWKTDESFCKTPYLEETDDYVYLYYNESTNDANSDRVKNSDRYLY